MSESTTVRAGQPSQVRETVDPDAKVSLRLRIGITGHRGITGNHPGLTAEIAKAAEYITQVLAADPARLWDGSDRARPNDIVLTVVSALAEGADRVVAGELLKRKGTELEVVLPLPQREYLEDFNSPESVEQFNHLIARSISTDVVRTTQSRDQAYELAGREVVDRSDAIIVVWDGKPARGRGGTAEIYAYAQRWHKPILLIRVDDQSARLDAKQLPNAAKGTCPLPLNSMKSLDQYNKEKLPSGAIDRWKPLLAQRDTRPWLRSAAPQIEHFSLYFTRADVLAGRFQSWYMGATRSMYALAPLAVLVAAGQSVFAPDQARWAWIEFSILIVITLLLIVTRGLGWHDRWISARYLAEQIRSLMFLGLTGIVTPERLISPTYRDTIGEVGWTERAANEIWFARPRYAPPADMSLLVEVLCEEWVKKQQEYHAGRSEAYRKQSSQVHAAAIGLFSLSALAALLHSLNVGSSAPNAPFKWWDWLAIAIPAVAGALGSYGAQRDYRRHAERSRLFVSVLDGAIARLVTAQDLRDVQMGALGVSRAMRSEATDWYSVVRSQDAELPS